MLSLVLPILLCLSAFASLYMGSLSFSDALALDFIISDLRLARIVIALLAGAALGLSGCLIQGVIRNPLAAPDLMGVSAGASVAATVLFLLFPALSLGWLIPVAIFGALATLGLLLLLLRHSNLGPTQLVLTGIALSIWLTAFTDWLLVSHPQQTNAALVWLTGSLWGRGWNQVWVLLPWFLVFLPCSLMMAFKLDLLVLGDETAQSLGVDVVKTRRWILFLAVVLAAVSVAVCGTLSFVGLIAPHLARLLVGGDHLRTLPAAAMIGALLVLIADLFARTLFAPLELPAGIFTALIGAPYFLFLLTRYRGW
ncbi:iron-dicitrate transporter subunit FecD [Marinomonas agarivorans]|nr:iron-dicitrate transporter subunit FecD [Marinomonas agarivorans]